MVAGKSLHLAETTALPHEGALVFCMQLAYDAVQIMHLYCCPPTPHTEIKALLAGS